MKNKTFTFEVELSIFHLLPYSQRTFAASINWGLARQADFYFGSRNWYATNLWAEERPSLVGDQKPPTRIFKMEVVGRGGGTHE